MALSGLDPDACYRAIVARDPRFPAGDLGLRKALGGVSAAECHRRSERWSPWRAYAAAHLWFGLSEETA
jgi:3-methyladenine DNA glycosylase/8-oxoguanine DNA glycosylase